MKTATVNAGLFRATSLTQSTEETRYYLNGVFLEPHPSGRGVLMTSTDGHRLVNVYDEHGECSEPGILALPPALLKECKAKRDTRLLTVIDGVPAIVSVNADLVGKEGYAAALADDRAVRLAVAPIACMVDGTFPDWRRVIPRGIKTLSTTGAAFNAAYLGDFADVVAAIANATSGLRTSTYDNDSKSRFHAMVVSSADSGSPALVRWDGIDHAFGVIMPMRADLSHDLPAYMSTTAPAKPAAIAA